MLRVHLPWKSSVPFLMECCVRGSAGSQHDFSAALGTYPPAQASHQAVAADRQLFMRTLRQLHDQLGTQFRIPMVSGRELDIHLLYKQVWPRLQNPVGCTCCVCSCKACSGIQCNGKGV